MLYHLLNKETTVLLLVKLIFVLWWQATVCGFFFSVWNRSIALSLSLSLSLSPSPSLSLSLSLYLCLSVCLSVTEEGERMGECV